MRRFAHQHFQHAITWRQLKTEREPQIISHRQFSDDVHQRSLTIVKLVINPLRPREVHIASILDCNQRLVPHRPRHLRNFSNHHVRDSQYRLRALRLDG